MVLKNKCTVVVRIKTNYSVALHSQCHQFSKKKSKAFCE